MTETRTQNTGQPEEEFYLVGLLPALQRLDALLERAVETAQAIYGPEVAVDPYRGLHIGPAEVERLLARRPAEPSLSTEEEAFAEFEPDVPSRLAWLRRAYDLSLFDLDLILIALAPDLDRRYERLYAYLQDHVSRRRATVDLALNLLCPNAASRLARLVHFDPDAPLIRNGLIHLIPEPNYEQPALLAHGLKLDEQIVRFLLHQDGLDARLAPCCRLVDSPDPLNELPLNPGLKQTLAALVHAHRDEQRPLRLYFHGPAGVGKRQAAAAVAAGLDRPLLRVDLARAVSSGLDFSRLLGLVFRYAQLYDVAPYLDNLDTIGRDEQSLAYQQLLETVSEAQTLTILAGQQPWTPTGRHSLGLIEVEFPLPGFAQRRKCWQESLTATDLALNDADLDTLAGRFRLTPAQITAAVTITAASQQPNHPTTQLPNYLFSAARAQSGHDLAALAHKIEPVYTWDDIVLPDDALAQLREICRRLIHRHRVLGEWGFDRKLSLGKGVNALFAGPSGTGKTMAAEIIANALQLALYKIDLAGVVSKYIGETEKNLKRIFTAAENANAILFFDEADALFGKRSEVRDSHDRYANIEISYLLQQMEAYDGLSILATNLRRNLDQAFIRRMTFTIHFPFPDEASRRHIWSGIWPEATPLAGELDFDFLARQFKLSGGNIKNIALAGAFGAAEDGRVVTMAHLLHATRREYQKMGKTLSEEELQGYHAQLCKGEQMPV